MISTMKKLFPGLLVAVLGFALVGCPKAKGPEMEEEMVGLEESEDELVFVEEEVYVPTLDVGTQWSTAPDFLESVYFDYMKADLTNATRSSLQKNAEVLKVAIEARPDLMVRVEGHADARGTLQYNMALGSRRAKAVSDYYASLGVPKSALSTVSYGEERPVAYGSGEANWAENRRVELKPQ